MIIFLTNTTSIDHSSRTEIVTDLRIHDSVLGAGWELVAFVLSRKFLTFSLYPPLVIDFTAVFFSQQFCNAQSEWPINGDKGHHYLEMTATTGPINTVAKYFPEYFSDIYAEVVGSRKRL